MYNLYAVSEHSGTTYGGHYTARCKHAFNGDWNYFNDARYVLRCICVQLKEGAVQVKIYASRIQGVFQKNC